MAIEKKKKRKNKNTKLINFKKKLKQKNKSIKKKINTLKKDLIKKFSKKNKKVVKKKEVKQVKKLTAKNITSKMVEEELKREKFKSRYVKLLMSTVYALIIVASVSALIATIAMPVFQISGKSMEPTLKENQIVVSVRTKDLKQGDVIAFYHGNKILVKRVIGVPGNWIKIDDLGNVYVNDVLLEEPYVVNKSLGNTDIKYPYQVPEETYFVLGDERSLSTDSRTTVVGSINYEEVIGKVLIKVWPLKEAGTVK